MGFSLLRSMKFRIRNTALFVGQRGKVQEAVEQSDYAGIAGRANIAIWQSSG